MLVARCNADTTEKMLNVLEQCGDKFTDEQVRTLQKLLSSDEVLRLGVPDPQRSKLVTMSALAIAITSLGLSVHYLPIVFESTGLNAMELV